MRAHFVLRIVSMMFCFSAVAVCADWNPKLAAEYLDSRQKDWAVWPRAAQANGPCFSCHTGMTYMLARPALRSVLNEKQPTEYETAILERMRAKAGAEPPGTLQGVETIFTALFLARNDPRSDGAIKKAFDQLWALQISDGRLKGAWRWYSVNLDPWETPPAFTYGASLAALALGSTPADYRNSPEIQAHIENLKAYLHAELANQPLHSRLAMLWASTAVPDLFTPSEQKAIIGEVLKKQQADGGWSLQSLGPWAAHPDAAPSPGTNSYATAFAAYVLLKAGVASSDPALRRTWGWLKANQDPKTGAWPASSMNKRYPAGSMEESFLQDAATAFASVALVEAGESNAQIAFDAASVKRNNSGAQQALIQLQPGGRFVARNVGDRSNRAANGKLRQEHSCPAQCPISSTNP